jgi:hypothetical protein
MFSRSADSLHNPIGESSSDRAFACFGRPHWWRPASSDLAMHNFGSCLLQFEHRARDRTPKSRHAIECAILIEDQVGLRIGTVGAVFKDI